MIPDWSNQPSECPVCGLTRHQGRFKLMRGWCSVLNDFVEKYWCQECNSFFAWDRVTGDVKHVDTNFPNGALLRCMKGQGIAKHVEIVKEMVEVNDLGVRVYVFRRKEAFHESIPGYLKGYVVLEGDKIHFKGLEGQEMDFDATTGFSDKYRIHSEDLINVNKALNPGEVVCVNKAPSAP